MLTLQRMVLLVALTGARYVMAHDAIHHDVAQSATPLLSYAAHQTFPAFPDQSELDSQLRQLHVEIKKDPPPEIHCAQTLGARRFAAMYDSIGTIYSQLGEDTNAIAPLGKAIDCNPRAGYLHVELASALLHLGRYPEARTEAERQVRPGHDNFSLYALLTQLDFIDERWPDAIAHARTAVALAPDEDQVTYWQCFLWLAQQHAGMSEPVLVDRHSTDSWPRPILRLLQGSLTEAELVEDIKSEPDVQRRREILSEALFYAGQESLAAHRSEDARRYFLATTRLNVRYFVEHHLAIAALARLKED